MNDELVLQGDYPARELGRRVWFVPCCDSTNALLLQERAGFTPGDVLWAGRQTQGRGRYGRAWFTAPGALALTALLTAADAQPARLPMVLALGMVRWLAGHGVDARIKWPNDVYWHGRKLAGILTEGEPCAGGWELRIGIGLNVQVAAEEFPAAVRDAAISLAQAGLPLTREQALAELLPQLDAVWQADRAGEWPVLREAVEEKLLWRGRWVRVTCGSEVYADVVHGLADNGGLRLADRTIMAGELEPLPEKG